MCLADRALLAERARQLQLPVKLLDYAPGARPLPHVPGTLTVAHQPLAVPSVAGRPDVRNARYVLALLDLAIDGALTGEFAALVTAPVQKSLLNEAGIAFSGHTEYLATRTGGGPPVMLLTERRAARGARHDAPAARQGERRTEHRVAVPHARDARAGARGAGGASARRASPCAA